MPKDPVEVVIRKVLIIPKAQVRENTTVTRTEAIEECIHNK